MRIGIDLGGTKTEGIVLHADGSVRHKERVPTPVDDYPGTVETIVNLIGSLESAAGTGELPVGIGTPGAISLKTGMMKNCNSTCLNGQPLVADVEALLGRPVRLANDADCFALSEASDGAGAGADSVFGVILGTGVGGGICHRGTLLSGVNAIAGEWGHNTLPLSGFHRSSDRALPPPTPGKRRCYCGRYDCVETWLAGPGFARSYEDLCGMRRQPAEIVAAAESGEAEAALVLDQYCNLLALGLATVINIVDPEVIVLGGGMSNVAQLYRAVPMMLGRYVFSDQIRTELRQAKFGDSSGVRGAAWLWPDAEPS